MNSALKGRFRESSKNSQLARIPRAGPSGKKKNYVFLGKDRVVMGSVGTRKKKKHE